MLEENRDLWRRLYDLRTGIAALRRLRMVSHVAREELHADIYFPFLDPPADDFFTRLFRALAGLGAAPHVPAERATPDEQVRARMEAALAQIDQLYADVYDDAAARPADELAVVEAWLAETQRAYRRTSADMACAITWTTAHSVK